MMLLLSCSEIFFERLECWDSVWERVGQEIIVVEAGRTRRRLEMGLRLESLFIRLVPAAIMAKGEVIFRAL
jgi:hypothetical protein